MRWMVLGALAACVQSQEVPCADGRLCPPGTRCDDENQRCVSDDQIAACAGLADGEPCTFSGAPGACRMGACTPLVCGDGVRSIGEACDGGDLGGADCTSAGFYDAEGLVCTAFCTFDVAGCTGFCGDGVINGAELCDTVSLPGACLDYGFDAGPIGCASSCGLSFADCGRFGWVSEATTLTNAYALDGTSPTDLWVAGQAGTSVVAAHFDGVGWKQEALGVTNTPLSIAAAAQDDVWVVGDKNGATPAVLLHRTAGQWNVVTDAPAADYKTVWAAGPSAVFVGSANAGVLRWNGSTWDALGTSPGSVVAMRGTSADDIWVALSDGTLARWTGSAWAPVTVAVNVTRIEPISPDDVWVIGASSADSSVAAAAHWDGNEWTVHVNPLVSTTNGGYVAIAASAGNDVWVSGPSGTAFHYNGLQWSPAGPVAVENSLGGYYDIRHFGETVIAITFDGFAYRYRHQMYARFTPGSPGGLAASYSASPASTIVIDRNKSAYHFDGDSWTARVVDQNALVQGLTAIGGSSATNVWVGGTGGRTFRFDGASWTELESLSGKIHALEVFSPDDVWFVTATTVVRYNGSTFEDMVDSNPGFSAGGASSATNVWAAGTVGASSTELWHYNGAQWSQTPINGSVTAMAVVSPTSVFAIASPNIVLQWNGATWTETPLPAANSLIAVAATAPDDAFAVTRDQMFHYDGTSWSLVRAPADSGIGTRSIANIWAAPDRVDLVYSGTAPPQPMRRLLRTRPWSCRASETGCSDGVDDDCDGAADNRDADCP